MDRLELVYRGRPMPVDALFWDNDGVLVDTEELFYQANREILAEHGIDLDHDTFAECSLGRGKSLLDLIEGLAPDERLALRDRRNAIYEVQIRRGVQIFAGVEDCLDALHGQLPMAIVTSAFSHHFDIIHRQTQLLRFFEFAIKGGDYENHKPHPEPYLLAAARLGVDPANCVVVEDSERGLEAATRAGMRCVVVPNRLSLNACFDAAHSIVQSVRELPAILSGMRTGG